MAKVTKGKNRIKVTYGEEDMKGLGSSAGQKGLVELSGKVKGMDKKSVECNDCPTPEICAKQGCRRKLVNKNFMGSKGKPIEFDVEF